MIRTILAATALSLAAMPALASTTEQFEMNVNIDRSTLQTTEGAKQEFSKLKQDVHDRCVAESSEWAFSTSYAVSFCESRTLKSAVTTINEPALTAVYEASVSR
nr:UrcA family protein [uncultured Hyphomonas sp.]